MLHQLMKFDRDQPFILACSGGVDSMAALDFYRRGGKKFTIAYFDHKTGNRSGALSVIFDYAIRYNLQVEIGKLSTEKPTELSPEEHWRNERYAWLHSYKLPVVTCHHLNDVAESWLFGAIHGKPKLIASVIEGGGRRLYRPFLTNTKQDLINWCTRHQVKWFEDTSNQNVKYPRNRIRHNILHEALKINPGLLKVLKKKILTGVRESWLSLACVDLE